MGQLLALVLNTFLLPALAAILFISAVKIWKPAKSIPLLDVIQMSYALAMWR
ncbi:MULTISPECIES: hypothetical protein [unclassified Mesorhizobium]|uniref:hypothetical protein n=1 Tax=unclassified Mesorhizobium TaxID=325217 RepID=UPI00333BDBD4